MQVTMKSRSRGSRGTWKAGRVAFTSGILGIDLTEGREVKTSNSQCWSPNQITWGAFKC